MLFNIFIMAIKYKFEYEQDVLKVITEGKDENLDEVMDYAHAVLKEALIANKKKIFCDERHLEYTLSTIDTYELATKASDFAPKLKKIAIVCMSDYLEKGKFYETVASNRGLTVMVPSDYNNAVEWIK